jgi:nitrite reductase/ring-hydroxylating ferredoxin subunit
MSEKKYQWRRVASHPDELICGPNGLCTVEVNGKKITLAKWQQQVYACAHKCPHAGGLMAEGFIDPLGNIVCPLHRYKFSLQNGRNTSGEGFYLKTWPVRITEEGVFVGMEEKSGWLGW